MAFDADALVDSFDCAVEGDDDWLLEDASFDGLVDCAEEPCVAGGAASFCGAGAASRRWVSDALFWISFLRSSRRSDCAFCA